MSALMMVNRSLAEVVQQHTGKADVRLVFGEGQAHAPLLMWVGEAPGEQEERQLRPFVGKAGANLDELLRVMGINRNQIYITNVVKYRPCSNGPTGRLRNRPPTAGEITLFAPWLFEEIALVSPRYLVTLGNTPLQALLGREARVGDMHGQWQLWRGIPLYPMYHPAAVIYRRELAEACQQDAQALAHFLQRHNEC